MRKALVVLFLALNAVLAVTAAREAIDAPKSPASPVVSEKPSENS